MSTARCVDDEGKDGMKNGQSREGDEKPRDVYALVSLMNNQSRNSRPYEVETDRTSLSLERAQEIPIAKADLHTAGHAFDEEEDETNYGYERVTSLLDENSPHGACCRAGVNPVNFLLGMVFCFVTFAGVAVYGFYLDVTFAKMNHAPLPRFGDKYRGDGDITFPIWFAYTICEF
ncbi:hypothetical protein ACHAWF_005525 [Thalassiosira exigua]